VNRAEREPGARRDVIGEGAADDLVQVGLLDEIGWDADLEIDDSAVEHAVGGASHEELSVDLSFRRARIDARIAAITPTVLELRRQGVQDPDVKQR
jgi:hypothetical protein